MDVRPIILAATFLLLVVSVVVFFVAVVRASSRSPEEPVPAPTAVHGASVGGPVDTDLAGLDLKVSPEALSATLLTPLRTGEWAPPPSPAPIEELPGVALAERMGAYAPVPDIPEPAFNEQPHEEWVVDLEALTAVDVVGEPSPVVRPVAPEPEPAPRAPVVFEQPPVSATDALDDDFHAEIAALLPTDESQPTFPQPKTPPPVAPEPEPVPVMIPPVAPEPEPVPVMIPPVAPEPVAEFWEQTVGPAETLAPEAPVASQEAPRPAVKLAPALDEPSAMVETPPQSAAPARTRPVARVHVADGGVVEYDPQRRETPQAPRRDVPDLFLEAPVEMWFGETRVGVKAGTATYERFRKYADALFDDLQRASSRT